MRIVAVMACRNEAAFLPTCLHHLVQQGIDFAIVDNGSSDGSLDIAHSAEFRHHFVGLTRIPYNGCFELEPLLRAKMALVESVVSDWAMNICPDEILHANRAGTSLAAEVARLEEEGFNAVNFDEFVFLPVAEPWVDGLRDWPAPRSYYFFAPSPLRQMRLWKKELGFSMVRHAGHRLEGDHLRPAPDSLVLRHYIFRNQEHAYEKYATRPFSPQELARGWHRNRYGIPATSYRFPAPETLEWLESPQSCTFNRSAPRLKHYWDS